MFPKEHGAYGQLLFSLATALAIGRPRVSALALAAAAVCGFLAHEPLLVAIGQRGARVARERGAEAWRWLAVLGTTAAALAIVSVLLMPVAARIALIVPAVFLAAFGVAVATRREHTTGGEILSGLTLASLALPVALAADATEVAALTVSLVFAAAFVVAIVSVRAMIGWARHPGGASTRVGAAVLAAGLVLLLGVLARAGVTLSIAPWAAFPVCAVGFCLAVLAPSPRRVRTIGWILVGAMFVAAVLLVAGPRETPHGARSVSRLVIQPFPSNGNGSSVVGPRQWKQASQIASGQSRKSSG